MRMAAGSQARRSQAGGQRSGEAGMDTMDTMDGMGTMDTMDTMDRIDAGRLLLAVPSLPLT
jgi:hypothetical protein